ncbi:MAG: TIM barrel protein [Candidatus Rokubacteria bacterium]|nr:TIM barrel protein [Candidatus Rokubacteria bacterium]
MIRYAANLTLLFNETPFLERFGRAAAAGFRAVEFLFAHNVEQDGVERELRRHGLELVLFDPEAGDFAAGDRGYLCDPARRDHLQKTIDDAIATAKRLGCRRLNVLAGNRVEGSFDDAMRRTVVENLKTAAPRARAAGMTLLIEALNTWESPRYFLDRSRLGLEIVREVSEPNVRFQYDAYHMQRMEGQLIETLTKNLQWIGHVQIADVPGRHEPGTGEVNYRNLLAALEAAGYDGYVGLEYRPSGKTEDSLAWLPREARSVR